MTTARQRTQSRNPRAGVCRFHQNIVVSSPRSQVQRASRLAEKELEKSVGTASEGRTKELDEIPAALLEYALGMAERAEAFDAMICAHPARTDPAERQIVLRDMHDRAVD